MTKFYTGIGSRETPEDICDLMTRIAKTLEFSPHGYILRSGGADGADLAFERGVTYWDNKQIYLPWKGFNDSNSELYLDNIREGRVTAAYEIAKKFYHSNLDRKSKKVKCLMTRNTFQIYGDMPGFNNMLSDFVVCWTKDGKASGGTGQALRIADHLGIPIYNLQNEKDKVKLFEMISLRN